MTLTRLDEELSLAPGHRLSLSPVELFQLEDGLPVWRFVLASRVIEKRLLMPRLQNTTYIQYRLLEGPAGLLELHPALSFRRLETPVGALDTRYRCVDELTGVIVHGDPEFPPLRLALVGAGGRFGAAERVVREVMYPFEAQRGYDAEGELWSPGWFRAPLGPSSSVTLVVTTETWDRALALDPQAALDAERGRRRRLLARAHPAARQGLGAELVLAADSFLFRPAGRPEGEARAHADGDEFCSLVAGYHWFADWGRDAMISLEGLLLCTGRAVEAADVITSFVRYLQDGLVPNMFPDGERQGRYNTADATLWLFHALDRYVALTGDRALLNRLLPDLREVIEHHLRGTRFGIAVDPADGLLAQGHLSLPLTWMDAWNAGGAVTPRRGKAVEVNALWYNALCSMERWLLEVGDSRAASDIGRRARRARESFNRRFWCEPRDHLFDLVDGDGDDDDACRPNQLFAVSLPNAVLERERWPAVVEAVRRHLLTPLGLRSLAPTHPQYHPRYFGALQSRDEAYHQGTVWPWLIGAYVDAQLKVGSGDISRARRLLAAFDDHLGELGIGTISEICDAEPPYQARGCIAQAWSVAEVLRSWVKTCTP